MVELNEIIEWPNGQGYTPCSEEYRVLLNKRGCLERFYEGESVDSYSREDYEEWHRLTDKLAGLQLDGHIGKSVRY